MRNAEIRSVGSKKNPFYLRLDSQRQYGRVERVFINRSDASKAPVFIQFTSPLSALRVLTTQAVPLDSMLTRYRL